MGRLSSGEQISLYVDLTGYEGSVHGGRGLQCWACHSNQRSYPHARSQATCQVCHADKGGGPPPAPGQLRVIDMDYPDARSVTLEANEGCRACHSTKFAETQDSVHTRIQQTGNPDAPVCVDCHGDHDITSPHEPRAKIPQTCAKCHLATYSSYRNSVHGAALLIDDNPDVPTCVDCHGGHSARGPTDSSFHNASVALCGGCHGDAARMNRYGISTDVFQSYLDDFHGRTVNLFGQAGSTPSNTATCFDCHGIHNILRPEDPQSSVYPANLQHTCQQCHADAAITFPQAWLSHYAPTPDRTPLLWAVNTFYRYAVPGLLLIFAAYIALDARRRVADGLRARAAERATR